MKPFLLIPVCLLVGCYTPSAIYKLNDRLQEGNPSYSLSVPTAAGRVHIRRVNPTIGFSATVSATEVTQRSPTNIPIQLQYHAMVPSPSMPVAQSTNQPARK